MTVGSFNESTKKILSSIFKEQPISRKQIAEKTGLSKASVSYGIEELLTEGIIVERGISNASANGGPRPINLYINADYAFVITIIMRANRPIVQVDNLQGETKQVYPLKRKTYDDFRVLLNEVLYLSDQAMEQFGRDRILGVGISVSGNVENNKVIHSPQAGLMNLDLADVMEKHLNKDVFIERDVHNVAYGEHWQGCGRKYDDFIAIWGGTGIGSATMIHSEIVRGANGLAGELGFMAIDPAAYEEKKYTLNDFGYLEKIASVKHIEDKYGDSFENLVQIAPKNEALLNDMYKMCDHLAMALTNAIVLLNVSAIVINGRLRYAEGIIREYLESRIQQLCPIECRIEFSFLGTKAITLGGTYSVLNKKLGISI